MGKPVLLALPDLSPAFVVEILPKGLVINRLLVNADGKTHDLVVGPNDTAQHGRRPHKYQNTIIGRYTNRIPTSSHIVSRNGASSTVQPLPNENPRSSLHGGVEGFDLREWANLDPAHAALFSDKEKTSIASLPSTALFSLVSPDGDQGFPGALLVEVLFAVSHGTPRSPSGPVHIGSLHIVYRAKLQCIRAVTPVNLTQHWGFNLDASLAPKGTPTPAITDHILLIKADKMIALDEDALSTGTLLPAYPPLAQPRRLGDVLPPSGADAFYVFSKLPFRTQSPTRYPVEMLPTLDIIQDILSSRSRDNSLVKLASQRSGLALAFNSNQPGVQFYTANHFNGEGTRKHIHGWSGRTDDGYGPRTFAFLEFHQPLAAWLHPGTISSGDDTLLTSDEVYNNFVSVDILFEEPPEEDL